MNKYERSMLSNLFIMKCVYSAILVLNLFMPLTSPFTLGFFIIFQWGIVIIHFIGLLNGLGYLGQKQNVPFLMIFFIRVGEILWYYFVSSKNLNLFSLSIVLILDVVFLVLLLIDKSIYKYEKVKKIT